MQSFTPTADTARDFRAALGRFATGVTVVTAPGPVGITVNSFASVSLDPPLVLWSPALASRRFKAFEGAERYAIHVLGKHQHAIGHGFVRDGAAFEELDWHLSDHGVPLIDDCLARFECRRHAIHEGGDHAIIVGEVERCTLGAGEPLIFSSGAYGRFDED